MPIKQGDLALPSDQVANGRKSDNKAIARRYVDEVANRRNLAAIDELSAFVWRHQLGAAWAGFY